MAGPGDETEGERRLRMISELEYVIRVLILLNLTHSDKP